ncbi:MAG: DUF5677 domain-containing protein [Acidobacteriota bacterium]|nr:DUF5677 domain-containing protein [Acidobacteriota bacterium]
MLPFEDSQVRAIWPDVRDEAQHADRLLDLVVSLFFDPGARGMKFRCVNELVLVTVMALLAKGCRTHRAVAHAAVNGLGEDAMTLARSLYETNMIALFILQKPRLQKQRAAMFHLWAAHQQLRMLRSWKVTPGLRRQAKKRDLAHAQAIVDTWQPRTNGIDVSKHWSGKGSLANAAQLLREDRSYQTIYRFLSAYGHGSDVAGAIEVDDNGKYVIDLAPNAKHTSEALQLSRMLLWVFAARMDKQWGFGFADRLKALKPPFVGRV